MNTESLDVVLTYTVLLLIALWSLDRALRYRRKVRRAWNWGARCT